jgi:hypothetical protein
MQKMNPNDPQVVIWTMWDGLTSLAAGHMEYSCFDHDGHSGGSLATQFTPRSESYLMGVRFGWWNPSPGDHVVYNQHAVNFLAIQALCLADESPN